VRAVPTRKLIRPVALRAFAGLSLALLALLACGRRKEPSPEYEKASKMHARLYADKYDDAYLDPKMGEVEALLDKVPANSLDAPGAQELRNRIQQGRERAQAAADDQAKARRAAAAPPEDPFGRRGPDAPPPPPVPEEKPDAGSAIPIPGMSMREFSARFTGCFRQDSPIRIQELENRERNIWVLKDITNCRDRFPGFDQLLLVEHDNTIWRFAQKSAIQYMVTDGGSPGGGAGGQSQDAGTP